MPLDEYYYGKKEGDPAYREQKGEFRFKVRGHVMRGCSEARTRTHSRVALRYCDQACGNTKYIQGAS